MLLLPDMIEDGVADELDLDRFPAKLGRPSFGDPPFSDEAGNGVGWFWVEALGALGPGIMVRG